MKRYHKLCFGSLLFVCSFTVQLSGQALKDRDVVQLPFHVLKVDKDTLSIHTILDSDLSFTSPDSFKVNIKPNDIYWVRVDLNSTIDTLSTQSIWRLRTPVFDHAEIYYLEKDILMCKAFGRFNMSEKMGSVLYTPGIPFKLQNLIDKRYLYIKARIFNYPSNISNWKLGYISDSSNRLFTHYYSNKDLNHLTWQYLFLGACLVTFIFFLAIFLYSKKLQFLFYSLYILYSIFYLVLPSINIPEAITFFRTPIGYWIVSISQVFINLFYTVFISYYLATKKTYPKLHKIIHLVVFMLIGIIILDAMAFFLAYYETHLHLLNLQRLLMTIYGIFGIIYLLFNAKDKLALFIVVGSALYMIGALAFLFLLERFYMILGSSLEIIVFSLGLAYKIKLEYEEKIILQEKVSLKEISALRAQMNPHFIFNSLNSIQHLILNNDRVSALKYLSKFGKLTRNLLENSIETKLTLADEIKLLNSYLELESLRFDKMFNYKINIAKDLDANNVEIPILLIQPFVENAIIHGLVNKEYGEKTLTICFKKQENDITCQIEDNGVGRIASKTTNSLMKKQKKSRGMEITEKRLDLLTHTQTRKSTIDIIDKYDSNGIPTGTKVIIRILEAQKQPI